MSCKERPPIPSGGYEYPKDVKGRDTNFYYYPLKDLEPRKKHYLDYFDYLFFRPFKEPNLSIAPQPVETFRITLSYALGKAYIITLIPNEIIIKSGFPPVELYREDSSKLTSLQNQHLHWMRNWFPFDTAGRPAWKKHVMDSLVKLYPQLADPEYYIDLYDKYIVKKDTIFNYDERIIQIGDTTFKRLKKGIDSSGYWQCNAEPACDAEMADGGGVTLEVNTAQRYKIIKASICPGNNTAMFFAWQNIVIAAGLSDTFNLVWKKTALVGDPSF